MAMLGSAAIGTLVKVRRNVESGGGRLVLAAVPKAIQKIFIISKLDSVFCMASSVDEALGDS